MERPFLRREPSFLEILEDTILLYDLATGVEMQKIPKCDTKMFKDNAFVYLASRHSRGFIVHVFQPNLESHTAVVPVGRKLILDSAEEFPMRLSERILRECGG